MSRSADNWTDHWRDVAGLFVILAAMVGFWVGAYWQDLRTPPERVWVCSFYVSDPMEDVETHLCSYNSEVRWP